MIKAIRKLLKNLYNLLMNIKVAFIFKIKQLDESDSFTFFDFPILKLPIILQKFIT